MTLAIQHILLSQLIPSDLNVRRTRRDAGDEAARNIKDMKKAAMTANAEKLLAGKGLVAGGAAPGSWPRAGKFWPRPTGRGQRSTNGTSLCDMTSVQKIC